MTAKLYHLSNGIPVAIDDVPHTQSAAVGIHIMVGARYEDDKNNGVAHFLEHMAFKGTTTRTALDLALEGDNLGVISNAFTAKEKTCYYMAGLGKDVSCFIDMLGDIVTHSTLPADELEKERGAIIQEIGMYKDDPSAVVAEGAEGTAYPAQPMGAAVLGPKENVQSFSRDTLADFMKQHYHAGNMLVTVAGNVDPQAVLADLEKALADVPAGQRSAFVPAMFMPGSFHKEKESEQLHLIMMFNSCAAGVPKQEYYSAELLGVILGGGMSSRLFQEIREKRGLVYGIGAGNDSSTDTGVFGITAATSPDDVPELTETLCNELKKIRDSGVTKQELARAKAQVLVARARANDSMQSRMLEMASQLQYDGDLVSTEEAAKAIESVTVESVNAAAKSILSGAPVVATTGPGAKVEPYAATVLRLAP